VARQQRKSGGGGTILALLLFALIASNPQAAGTQPAGPVEGDEGLTPAMQDAVAQLDAAMGGELVINSGYRSAAEQARVCAEVSAPCAPPGRSLHQHGLAIDVANHEQAAAALRAHPEIPLCQPLPDSDAVHFSHRDGSEC
jgi:hypothetical protein